LSKTLKVATWNVNHRVGKTRYRPKAAEAAVALNADLLVLTEYFPRREHYDFLAMLSAGGYPYALLSAATRARANRVLIASQTPIELFAVETPNFDDHMPANTLTVREVASGLVVIGLRIPWYERKHVRHVKSSWDWLENVARGLEDLSTVIAGDLNVSMSSRKQRGGVHFRRLLENGWTRARPTEGVSFPSVRGRGSEIDHILANGLVAIRSSEYVSSTAAGRLAGARGAFSDHNALVATVCLQSR
jgi:endonuclease/exonuclease/phosphatase family metal-dependent hydrolase